VFGGGATYLSQPPVISDTPGTEQSPPTPPKNPRELKSDRCEEILQHPAEADKEELLEVVKALAFAKEDRLSPILDELIDILRDDRDFRNTICGWALDHPRAAMKFALESERSDHPVVSSAKSAALVRPDGAKVFIEHARIAGETESIHWPDLAQALAITEQAGIDPVETINSLPEALRQQQFTRLLVNRSQEEPKEAFDLAISDPALAEASKAVAFEIFEGLFEQNPGAATTFLDRVPDAARTEFATAAVSALLSTGNSAAAFQLAYQLLTSDEFDAKAVTVLQYLTNGHINSGLGTGELVDWLQALPTDELKAEGEKVFITQIIRLDPETAIPWLKESKPGAIRDQYLARLIYDLPNDHESFNPMLRLIEDTETRSSIEERVANRPRFDLSTVEQDAN
jgi:hypothetical protein